MSFGTVARKKTIYSETRGTIFRRKASSKAAPTGARAGTAVRMSSMVELVVAVVGLLSACIFLAHAIEAYRA
jgi:hypothetical protein